MAARLSASLVQCIILLIALAANQSLAAESWVRLETPHFDLYSSLNRKQAALVLNQLEDARRALETVNPGRRVDGSPVRVIAFRSENEFSRYRPNDASSAYYLRADGREYIVFGQEVAEGGTAVVHEYVHHWLHQWHKNLPLWLDEGLAEVYSTAVQESRGLRVGLPPADRLDWLKMDAPAYDLPTLFSMRQSSFTGVKRLTPRSRFYAESWLLVHMLRFSPEYADQFQAFLDDVEQGAQPAAALQRHYGKTVSAVMDDMQAYLKANRIPTELVRVSEEPAVTPISTLELPRADWEGVLADLRTALARPQEASAAWTK